MDNLQLKKIILEEAQQLLKEDLWRDMQDALGIPTYNLKDVLNKPRWVNKRTGEALSDIEYVQKYIEWHRKKELGLDPRLQGNRRGAETGYPGYGRRWPVTGPDDFSEWNPRITKPFYPPDIIQEQFQSRWYDNALSQMNKLKNTAIGASGRERSSQSITPDDVLTMPMLILEPGGSREVGETELTPYETEEPIYTNTDGSTLSAHHVDPVTTTYSRSRGMPGPQATKLPPELQDAQEMVKAGQMTPEEFWQLYNIWRRTHSHRV